MLFPTLSFALFFLIVFAAHRATIAHARAHKVLLLVASYWFYGAWDWRFCFLLLMSSLINYGAGVALRSTDDTRRRKLVLALGIAANLAILGFFKYYGFFVESLDAALHVLGWQRDLLFLDLILPVGISFFTFQGISYVVDTYRGKLHVAPGLVDVLLYISFFPQLVAGPIVRAAHFLPQLTRPPAVATQTTFGLTLIVWGLFKKVVVATHLAENVVDPVFFDPLGFGTWDVLIATYAYAVQIYCDFSAYSDIAIGVAALLGFQFPRNFDQPYRAASLRDFWRRWHISLSSWLRDYLYIPLGGGRNGAVKTYRNLFITMLLGGLWHGASWQFIAWGAMHGAGLAVERAVRNMTGGLFRSWPAVLRIVLVFHFVCAAWVLFRAETFELATDMFAQLRDTSLEPVMLTPFVLTLTAFGLAMHAFPATVLGAVERRVARLPVWLQGAVFGLAVIVVDALGIDGVAPFIYFQF
ncbi:MAG: MBOAT family protein [Pseudomonadota bacterium]